MSSDKNEYINDHKKRHLGQSAETGISWKVMSKARLKTYPKASRSAKRERPLRPQKKF